MAWTETFAGAATIGTTEHSLTNNSTTIASRTDKVALSVVLDFSALAAGDQYEVRILEKCRTSTGQHRLMSATITGTMANIWMSPTMTLGNGWDVTVQKIAGTNRSINWSLRAFPAP